MPDSWTCTWSSSSVALRRQQGTSGSMCGCLEMWGCHRGSVTDETGAFLLETLRTQKKEGMLEILNINPHAWMETSLGLENLP